MRSTPPPSPSIELLPGLPRAPLTPQQQVEALRRVQAQAEQRVKLGMQLFKAAEAHVSQHRDALQNVKAEQDKLRAEIQNDVAKSLQQYDQWIGRIDESFTRAMQGLEERLGNLEQEFQASLGKVDAMVARTEILLDQARCLVAGAAAPPLAPPASLPASPELPAAFPPPPVRTPPRKAQPTPPAAKQPEPTPAPPSPAPQTTPADPQRIYSQLLKRLDPGSAEAA